MVGGVRRGVVWGTSKAGKPEPPRSRLSAINAPPALGSTGMRIEGTFDPIFVTSSRTGLRLIDIESRPLSPADTGLRNLQLQEDQGASRPPVSPITSQGFNLVES